MTKLLIGLLGAGVIATGGYAAATSVDADPARTVSLPGATSTGDTTTADATTADTTTAGTTTDDANDISGPCDEAEHRNDPRCTGINAPAPAPSAPATTTDDVNDISGPCDEAEHASDPRCTGGAAGDDRDDGRGGDDDNDERGDDDDNSGHGSGKTTTTTTAPVRTAAGASPPRTTAQFRRPLGVDESAGRPSPVGAPCPVPRSKGIFPPWRTRSGRSC